MREIKFRGKTINGDWVYGYYSVELGKHYIINESNGTVYRHAVSHETVGQSIGLPDKNEKEIYEGDILHEFREKTAPMANNGIDRKIVVDDIRSIEFYSGWCEVIGNIYSNPELLNNEPNN